MLIDLHRLTKVYIFPCLNRNNLRLKHFLKSKFFLNFVKLSTSAGLGKLIFFAFTPIITRIYYPDQFAQLAFFTSLVVVLNPIFNGRYDLAFVVAKKEFEVRKLFLMAIVLIILSIISSLLLIRVYIPYTHMNILTMLR